MVDHDPSTDAIDRAAACVRNAPKGDRNHTLNRQAYTLGGIVPAELLADAERVLVAAATDAGLPDDEARKVARRALHEGAGKPLPDSPPARSPRRAGARKVSALPPRPRGHELEPGSPPTRAIAFTTWGSLSEPTGGVESARTLAELAESFRGPKGRPTKDPNATPVWNAAIYRDGRRKGGDLRAVHGLVVDLDEWPEASEVDLANACGPFAYAAHTTASHRPGEARWRVVLPLAEPVRATVWEKNQPQITDWITLRFAAARGELAAWSGDKLEQKTASGIDVLPPSQAFYVPHAGEHYQSVCDLDGDVLPLLEAIEAELPMLSWSAKRARAAVESPMVGRMVRVADTGWLNSYPPAREYLLRTAEDPGDGVLALGKVGMLAAEGGAGKTMALAQLAVAVAAGATRWLGWKVEHSGPVVVLLGEEDEGEAHRRLYNAAEALQLSLEQRGRAARNLTIAPLAGVPCAWTRKGMDGEATTTDAAEATFAELREIAADRGAGWALVVVDPLSRFAGLDAETDASGATRFVQVVERLTHLPGVADDCGPTVLVAHHTNKASRSQNRGGASTDSTAARGSSALTDGVRWQAQLEKVYQRGIPIPGFAVLHVTKSNYALRPEPVLLARGEFGILREPTAEDRVQLAEDRKRIDAEAAKKKAEKAATEKAATKAAAAAATKGALP